MLETHKNVLKHPTFETNQSRPQDHMVEVTRLLKMKMTIHSCYGPSHPHTIVVIQVKCCATIPISLVDF